MKWCEVTCWGHLLELETLGDPGMKDDRSLTLCSHGSISGLRRWKLTGSSTAGTEWCNMSAVPWYVPCSDVIWCNAFDAFAFRFNFVWFLRPFVVAETSSAGSSSASAFLISGACAITWRLWRLWRHKKQQMFCDRIVLWLSYSVLILLI